MSADKSKIIDRIQKLLALATSSNVHEAALAAARAQELMAKYDIEQAMLDVETGEEDIVVDEEVLAEMGARVDGWKGVLATALGHANGATVFQRKAWKLNTEGGPNSPRNYFQIIGTKDQASTVRYMYAYLVNEVERLAKTSEGSGRAWMASFRLGAASTISQRLREAAAHAKNEAKKEAHAEADLGNGAALVRLDGALARLDQRTQAIAAHARKLHLRSQKSRGRVSSGGGYEAGKRAGASVRLGGGPALGKGSSGSLRS